MTDEQKRERASRLVTVYRELVNNGQHGGKVWDLERAGRHQEAVLLDRCARTAAVVAFYQSIGLSDEQIERQLD